MTGETIRRKRGRPPRPGGPMSGAEKQKRYIERLKREAKVAGLILDLLRRAVPRLERACDESNDLEARLLREFGTFHHPHCESASRLRYDVQRGRNAAAYALKLAEEMMADTGKKA